MRVKIICLLAVIFPITVNGETLEEVVTGDIEYSLNCNAKFGSVSEVVVSGSKSKKNGTVIVYGHYKQAIAFNFKSFQGGEFNRLSGSFKGMFKESDGSLLKLKWKVGIKEGLVKANCLKMDEW